MSSPPTVEWLTDWRRTSVDPIAQRQYISEEIARIAALGAPVLTQVMSAPLEVQTVLALSILNSDTPIPEHRFLLRVVPGSKLPDRDPQGRELSAADKGKVLVCKIGTKGGQLNQSSLMPEAIVGAYSGPAVQRASTLGQDIYQYVRLTTKPLDVPVGRAAVIMRAYGNLIAMPRYRNRGKRDANGNEIAPLDFWLVEEIPPAWIAPDGSVRDPKAESQPTGKRAA